MPTCLFDRRDRLEGCADLFCLLFTVERKAEVRRLVDCAQRGENPLPSLHTDVCIRVQPVDKSTAA